MKYKHNGEWKELKIKPFDSLPIDSIIEYNGDTIPEGYQEVGEMSGSNSNGSWIKFADGTMICYGFKNIGGTTTGGNVDGSLYYVDIGLLHSFPQEFIDIPNVKINVYTNTGQTYHSIWAVLKASSYSKQGINGYRIYSPTNTTFNYSIDYIAIGRWK